MSDAKPFGGLTHHRAGVEKLRKFFNDNPEEELTVESAAAKIGVGERTAATYLSHLAGEGGDLERISVYRVRSR